METRSFEVSEQSDASFDVSGTTTSWADRFASGGHSFFYRVAAFNGAGTSAWSNVYQLPVIIDATQVTVASNWGSDSWGNTNYATGAGVGNGTMIGYRSLDLGSAANQLRVDLVQWNNAALFQGGNIAVYIDQDPTLSGSQPAALIPIGGPDSEIITGSIPTISGVHDIWFRFTAPSGHSASAGFQSFQFVQASSIGLALSGSSSKSTSFYLRLESDLKTLDIWQDQTPADGAFCGVCAMRSSISDDQWRRGNDELNHRRGQRHPHPRNWIEFQSEHGRWSIRGTEHSGYRRQ